MTALTQTQLKSKIGAVDLVDWQKDMADSAWLRGEKASQAQAEAGVADDVLMTPLKTTQAIAALGGVEINAQVDSYTLAEGDADKLVTITKGTAVNLTVPPDVFAAGDVIGLSQGGAGTVTVVAGVGVTINSLNSALGLSGQWAVASLLCTASNTFLLYGGIV